MWFLRLVKKIILRLLRRYYSFLARKSVGDYNGSVKANFRTKLTKNTSLGGNFNSNGLVVHGRGNVTIGDNFHCGKGCQILTENHNINGNAVPYDNTYIIKPVCIRNNVWLGLNVTVLPGVEIGEGAVIQANSTVVNDIPSLAIAGGHPATVFANRDEKLYKKLVKDGKFH